MKYLLTLVFFFLFIDFYIYATEDIDFIIINKSQRELLILGKNKVTKKFKISLGFDPVGKKIKKGDGKTPEGLYYLEDKVANSAFHLALKISYPNNWDIRNALKQGFHPGGQIMIHGLPNTNLDKNYHSILKDWTEGCIAVNNQQIRYLWERVSKGTPILIRK